MSTFQTEEYQLYFLLGKGPELDQLEGKERENQLEIATGIINEAKKHNDIVVGDFYDTYENLPIKTNLGRVIIYQKCSLEMQQFIYLYFIYSQQPLTGTLTDLKKAFQLEITPIILLRKLHCILKLLYFVVKFVGK